MKETVRPPFPDSASAQDGAATGDRSLPGPLGAMSPQTDLLWGPASVGLSYDQCGMTPLPQRLLRQLFELVSGRTAEEDRRHNSCFIGNVLEHGCKLQ